MPPIKDKVKVYADKVIVSVQSSQDNELILNFMTDLSLLKSLRQEVEVELFYHLSKWGKISHFM